MAQNRLILASASPRRVMLLEQIGIKPYLTIPADINELPYKAEKPSEFAKRMALSKALKISTLNNDKFVLAADTVVATGRTIFPKVETEDDVYEVLTRLCGRNHRVYGGICLIKPGGMVLSRIIESKVFIRRLSRDELLTYVTSGDWKGKAGGYAIQGKAAQFIKKISGSYSNIVGLDIYTTANLLKGCGFNIG